jgi:DNA mismatch endonuclease (patch repair protein)
VIFVDGCFWHGHDCRNTRPKDNADYWTKKRERNVKRDKEVTENLQNKDWTVIRLWECELKKEELLEEKFQTFSTSIVVIHDKVIFCKSNLAD